MKAQQNFDRLMSRYASEREFVFQLGSPAYNEAERKFSIYSDWFKSVMGYDFFLKNVMG